MFFVQACLLLTIWLIYGWRLWLRLQPERDRPISNRTRATVLAMALLIGGVGALFLGLSLTGRAGGISQGNLTLVGFIAVAIIGCFFVHSQGAAASMLFRLVHSGETGNVTQPSIDKVPTQHENDR